MKKVLLMGALALSIGVSMVSGTLAAYEKTAMEQGVVSAKYFNIEVGANHTIDDVSLSPGEKEEWVFDVVNYSGQDVTETDMDLGIEIAVGDVTQPKENQDLINGLKVELFDITGGQEVKVGESVVEQGRIFFKEPKAFEAGVKEDRQFKVVLDWESQLNSIDSPDGFNKVQTPVSVIVNGKQSMN